MKIAWENSQHFARLAMVLLAKWPEYQVHLGREAAIISQGNQYCGLMKCWLFSEANMKVKYKGQYSHSVISKLSTSLSFVVTPLSVSVTNVDNFEL